MFDTLGDLDLIRVVLADGRSEEGQFQRAGGMFWLNVKDPSTLLGSRIVELDQSIVEFERLLTRAEHLTETRRRSRGEPYPGRSPKTAEDFQYRLDVLARAMLSASDTDRRWQLEAQFEDVADQIELSRAKREWIVRAARWSLTHNQEPTMVDLWMDDIASPSLLRRPRPQDFDPSAAVRRQRVPHPFFVTDDPLSIPNLLSALKAAQFDATISRYGDPEIDIAYIKVPLAADRVNFELCGRRQMDSSMHWRLRWGGNSIGKTALRKYRNAVNSERYAFLVQTLNEQAAKARAGMVHTAVVPAEGLRAHFGVTA